MNFTHFMHAGESLNRDLDKSRHDLLRRSAALQLATNQSTYDHLIPIYLDPVDTGFEPSRCGVVLVQVNRVNPTTIFDISRKKFDTSELNAEAPKVDHTSGLGTRLDVNKGARPETRTPKEPKNSKGDKPPLCNTPSFCFGNMENPILFLLLDLGVDNLAARLQISRSCRTVNPRIWDIRSEGNGKEIFGCVTEMGCKADCKIFFKNAVSEKNLHNELAGRNKVFGQLSCALRHQESGEEIFVARNTDTGTRNQDESGDVRMGDVDAGSALPGRLSNIRDCQGVRICQLVVPNHPLAAQPATSTNSKSSRSHAIYVLEPSRYQGPSDPASAESEFHTVGEATPPSKSRWRRAASYQQDLSTKACPKRPIDPIHAQAS
ncbi:MAG: hypothetical protein M1840_008522 [Geoglossum simile]|nr:MAG: hypothetical protein M1840_008522 [Geoglossum simile]